MNMSTKRIVLFQELLIPFLHTYIFPAVAFVREHILYKIIWMGYPMRLELIRVVCRITAANIHVGKHEINNSYKNRNLVVDQVILIYIYISIYIYIYI